MAANSLPSFLLPRLSWASTPVKRRAFHTASQLSQAHRTASSVPALATIPQGLSAYTAHKHQSGERSRRWFSTTRKNCRDHHFDTLKFVQRLKSEGFSEEQSQALKTVLSDVIEESIQNLTRTMVLKEGRLIGI